MKSISILALTLLCLAVACRSPTLLFDENNTTWQAYGAADWTIVEDSFTARVSDTVGFVMTNARYDDFELELEFRPDSSINSGVFVRCSDREISFTDCYEVNIWDLHPDQTNRTGAIVARQPPMAHVETVGRWNAYRIRVKNDRIRAWVNGSLTADLTDAQLPTGYIALQAGGTGTISFRRVRIREI